MADGQVYGTAFERRELAKRTQGGRPYSLHLARKSRAACASVDEWPVRLSSEIEQRGLPSYLSEWQNEGSWELVSESMLSNVVVDGRFPGTGEGTHDAVMSY